MVLINNQSINAEIARQQGLSQSISTYETQISTGVKLDKPSDDPSSWIQISQIGKQQAMTDAWQTNLKYAQSRAAQASSSLTDVNNLMTQVTNLLVTASGQAPGSTGAQATAQELAGIRDSIKTIMNQTDYQGTPTFDSVTTTIPVGQGMNFQAVVTQGTVENGAYVDNNTTPATSKSIYDVLNDAIAAVNSTDQTTYSATINTSLGEARSALDHVIDATTSQAVMTQRLSDQTSRLSDSSLQLTERRSSLEDTDLSEVITKLQTKLVSLQAAQAAFVKINQQSLFSLIS